MQEGIRGPPAISQAPSTPGVLFSLESMSPPPSAAGCPQALSPCPLGHQQTPPPRGRAWHKPRQPGWSGRSGASVGRLHGKAPHLSLMGCCACGLGFRPRGLVCRHWLSLPVRGRSSVQGPGPPQSGEAAAPPPLLGGRRAGRGGPGCSLPPLLSPGGVSRPHTCFCPQALSHLLLGDRCGPHASPP